MLLAASAKVITPRTKHETKRQKTKKLHMISCEKFPSRHRAKKSAKRRGTKFCGTSLTLVVLAQGHTLKGPGAVSQQMRRIVRINVLRDVKRLKYLSIWLILCVAKSGASSDLRRNATRVAFRMKQRSRCGQPSLRGSAHTATLNMLLFVHQKKLNGRVIVKCLIPVVWNEQ